MSTTLVTGGTGFIGSWVVKQLLEKGYTVRITARDKNRKDKFAHLSAIADASSGTLEVWEADLLKQGSFDEAAKGCEGIIHIASPFILDVKDAQKDLVDPAVKGTQNVLSAASKSGTVKKVVLTSSVASVHGDSVDMKDQNLSEFTEEQWNTTSTLTHQPYSFSKVQAEKSAWKIADAQSDWKLVVINPAFVLGPTLIESSSSESLKVMRDMLKGKFRTGAAELYFGFVDVRDVAKAHVLALESDTAEGRHIISERVMNFLDMANVIGAEFPGKYKLPKSLAPKFMMYLMGWAFGATIKFVKQNIGYPIKLNSTKSREALGLEYIKVEDTIKDMVNQMEDMNMVR